MFLSRLRILISPLLPKISEMHFLRLSGLWRVARIPHGFSQAGLPKTLTAFREMWSAMQCAGTPRTHGATDL
jgi:hypothetical protein